VWVHRFFGNKLPSLEDLKAEAPHVVPAIRRVGGWKEVIRFIHPTVQDLMPFITLLTCHTFFNKAVLAEFELDDVERTHLFGSPRIVMHPLKRRAG
jgi:hypothetical protein